MNSPRRHPWGVKAMLLLAVLLLGLPVAASGAAPEAALEADGGGYQIHLKYASFDPLKDEPFIPALLQSAPQEGAPGLYLVQFDGPVQAEWLAAAEGAGARLYDYIADFAFLARMDPAAAARLRALPFVRWSGVFHPAYRLDNSLRPAIAEGQTAATLLEVQSLPDADQAGLIQAIASLGGQVVSAAPAAAPGAAGYLRVSLPAGKAGQLAALDGVLWIEPFVAPEWHNDTGGGGIMRADGVRSALGLFGSGQIVGIADSGLDTGNLSTIHPDFAGRILKTYALGRPGDWSDYISHGTHVAGSVLGSGSVSGANPSSHQYSGSYAGVAPEAQLVMQSVADATGSLGGIPTDRGDLMRQAYLDGARIHSNSWGSPVAGAYNTQASQVDAAAWQNKDMLILFSAGNSGVDGDMNGLIDLDSIGSPGSAKNVLTVGASENNRSYITSIWGSSYGQPIASDQRADDADGMAAFSSRGPTDDGRIKPEVVAPGTFIASTRTRRYVFNDNLEGSTAGYTTNTDAGGTGNSWQLISGDAHSATHAWRESVSGSFNVGAVTFLLTPPMDVRPTGGVFDVHFWHKYTLSAGDSLLVVVWNNNTGAWNGFRLNESGSTSVYSYRRLTFSLSSLFPSTPSSVSIAFGIESDGSSSSTWNLDDIRVDGADWGTLGTYGLATPGDAEDEAYLMMGGTSMSTPLTAGAAALVREWLTRVRGFASPSAALMKGVLINGAADMSPGQYTTPQEVPNARPNNVTGWGRVDLVSSLNPTSPQQVWLLDNTSGLATGNVVTYTLTTGWTGSMAQGAAQGATGEVTLYGEDWAAPALAPAPGGAAAGKGEAERPVVLKLDNVPDNLPDSQPQASTAAVSLVLDDGQHEFLYTLGTAVAYQFIWLNRFTPAVSEFPFQLEQIQAMFDNVFDEPGGEMQVGDPIQFAIYQDADGDPLNGASLLATVNATIQAVDGTTWSVYNLSTPVQISGPGDVLIAAINRFVVDGVSPLSYPAALDATNPQFRTWRGWWNDIPPDPPLLPTDNFFEMFSEGRNALLRGYGTTTTTPPPPPPPTGSGPLRLTLVWTDQAGSTLSAKALVNDLDLKVIAPDNSTYYGNSGTYSSGQCLRSSVWDACNNVESVILPSAPYGAYRVVVRGYNVPQGPQPFALVASGDNLLGTAPQPQSQHVYLPLLSQ